MADENKLIDIEGLSHFKSKLDNEYNEKFKSKSDSTDLKGAVRYDTAQVLTEEQKAQAKANLGITEGGGSGGGTVEGAVRYDIEQILNDGQKAKARANIGTTDGTWANMPDKPFGETRDIVSSNVWEYSADAEPYKSFDIDGATVKYYRISDQHNANVYLGAELELPGYDETLVITQEQIQPMSETAYGIVGDTVYIWVVTAETDIAPIMGVTGSLVFEAGSYAAVAETAEGVFGVTKITATESIFSVEAVIVKQIEAKYLPTYVDDVVEGIYDSEAKAFLRGSTEGSIEIIVGERGKIYLDIQTNNTYRWSGTQYVRINPDEYTVATNNDIDALFT